MKLEQQVCSLELSKSLKELGVKQESAFVWRHWRYNGQVVLDERRPEYKDYAPHRRMLPQTSDIAAAFTVAELGEMLQEGMTDCHKTGFGRWRCAFMPSVTLDGTDEEVAAVGDTEADARAKMLIYLLENKLITN